MIKKILIFLLLTICSTTAFADGPQDAVENYYNNKTEYVDLAGFEWASPAIYHLSEYGLIDDDSGKIYPQKYINRAEFTKLLVGAFGLYDFDAQCSFGDLDKTSKYYPYIASAYKLGIVKGVRTDWFGMEENLLRQDMVTMIYRTALLCKIDMSKKADVDFADASYIDGYAREAVSALAGAGAVSGNLSYQFLPKKEANFAEACKILYYVILKNT